MKPGDTSESDPIFLVLSPWAKLKVISCGTAETLFEKGHCIPELLIKPKIPNKNDKHHQKLDTCKAICKNKHKQTGTTLITK